MNAGQTVFSQLLQFFPMGEFRRAVARYGGNHRTRSLSCHDQFLAMAFAQLTCRDSLRDIVACLGALGPRVYHAGLRGRVARSTLADANDRRDWRIYAEVAQVLIARARTLYAGEALLDELRGAVFALDSSVISLCLKLCPWARFDAAGAAIKIHTLLDLRGSIPSVVAITPARVPDVGMLDRLAFEPGATYIMDRAYLDFARLARVDAAGAFFVVRSKSNVCLRTVARRPVEHHTGLLHDHTVRTLTPTARRHYPGNLRRVRYYDAVHDNDLMFLTNHMDLPALTIADLYRLRWQVETFFRWIKQHLRIDAQCPQSSRSPASPCSRRSLCRPHVPSTIEAENRTATATGWEYTTCDRTCLAQSHTFSCPCIRHGPGAGIGYGHSTRRPAEVCCRT